MSDRPWITPGLADAHEPVADAGQVRPDPSSTVAAWVAACLPAGQFLVHTVVYLSGNGLRWRDIAAASLLVWCLGVLLAHRDSRTLASRGYTPASPAWSFLTPIAYLAARGAACVRQNFQGYGPFLLHVAILASVYFYLTVLSNWVSAIVFMFDSAQNW